MVYWELILKKNQTRLNKYNILKNIKRVDTKYKVWDKVMLDNNAVVKYDNPYKVPFGIT